MKKSSCSLTRTPTLVTQRELRHNALRPQPHRWKAPPAVTKVVVAAHGSVGPSFVAQFGSRSPRRRDPNVSSESPRDENFAEEDIFAASNRAAHFALRAMTQHNLATSFAGEAAGLRSRNETKSYREAAGAAHLHRVRATEDEYRLLQLRRKLIKQVRGSSAGGWQSKR